MEKVTRYSKTYFWAGVGAVALVVALSLYSPGNQGLEGDTVVTADLFEPAESASIEDPSSQTAAGAGGELSRSRVDQVAVPANTSDSLQGEGGPSAPSGRPFRDYEQEIGGFLNSFVGESPDLSGWTDYFARLAIEGELNLESVYTDDSGTHGTLLLAGSDLSIDVTHQDEGYSLAFEAAAPIDSVGTVPFSAAMMLPTKEGNLERLYCTVQFFPDSSQSEFEGKPRGYLYEMEDGQSSFRSMRGMLQEGRFSIEVDSKENSRKSELGNLAVPYTLMLRLQELQASRND